MSCVLSPSLTYNLHAICFHVGVEKPICEHTHTDIQLCRHTNCTQTSCLKCHELLCQKLHTSTTVHLSWIIKFFCIVFVLYKWIHGHRHTNMVLFWLSISLTHMVSHWITHTRAKIDACSLEWPNGSICHPTRGLPHLPKFSRRNSKPRVCWSMIAL